MQHYTEFDSHTITTLEKILLGVGFFGTTMNHLACCQIILLIISRVLGLFLVVWFTTLAFWGIGFWLFLHLSFVSSKIITLFFSMSWHMLKSSLFPSSSHCGISKLDYPKLFIFKSLALKVLWYSYIFIYMFFYEPLTQIRICHNFLDATWTCLWSYVSLIMSIWLLTCPTTFTFHFPFVHSLAFHIL